MSLEQALAANTAAVELLTKVLAGASVTLPSPQGGATAKKPKADKTEATKSTETTPAATTPVVTGPSLKLVTDTVLDFAATESAAAKAILKSFGVSRITELKADTYPAVLKAVEDAKAKIAAELLAGDDDPTSLV